MAYGIRWIDGEELGVACYITPPSRKADKGREKYAELMLLDAGARPDSLKYEWQFNVLLEVPDGNQDLHSG